MMLCIMFTPASATAVTSVASPAFSSLLSSFATSVTVGYMINEVFPISQITSHIGTFYLFQAMLLFYTQEYEYGCEQRVL